MIKLKKATKKYGDGSTALDGVDVVIEDGEFVFLVGPTGAGKTTVFRLLTKEIELSSGEVEVDGEDLRKMRKKDIYKLRRKVGRIFQDLKLLDNRTIYENTAMVLEIFGKKKNEIDKEVKEVLKSVGILGFKDKFPAQLSGGELQRAAIARAIIGKPKYLLCDEPTADLDPETTWEIMDILRKINDDGTTLIVATHDIDIVNSFKKRVVKLLEGQVTSDKEGKYD